MTCSPTWPSRPSTGPSCTAPTRWNAEQGGQTAGRCRRHLPQRGQHHPADRRGAARTERRVAAPAPLHADRGDGRTYTAADRRRSGKTSTHGGLTNGHLKLHPNLHHLDGRSLAPPLLLQAARGPKYRAAFATAYGAGLRVSEVVALKVGDIGSERILLRIEQGKGGKDRHAMLSPQLLEVLRAWRREGRRLGALLPGGWLFPGRNPIEPLSTRQFRRAVHAVAEAAGIKKRVAPPGATYEKPAIALCVRPRNLALQLHFG